MYYDQPNQQQQQNYPETIATPSGGSGGGTGQDFNWSDFEGGSESQSSSYAGPSDWAKEWTQNYLNRFQPGLNDVSQQWTQSVNDVSPIGTLNAKQIEDLIANLMNTRTGTNQNVGQMRSNLATNTGGMRDLIEQSRKLMPQQYAEEMNLYNQRATQPVLNRMSNRGILNSDVTGGALSDVLRDTQAKQSDLVKQADLWAAQQNLDLSKYITDKGFDIDKYLADQAFTTNQEQTARMFTANDTNAERLLKQLAEERQGLKTTELSYANLIPSLLNALRESQSQSTGSSNSGLMELLLASQGG